MVDVPVLVEEALELERPAPGRVLKPRRIQRSVKAQALMTPDQQGAVYCEAVLELIRSARESLLFQIPYIGMPASIDAPRRGFLDDLIEALVEKLLSLPDARVLLRSMGRELSDPRHAAWFFKTRGVDVNQRVAMIADSHTKGMIVDGRKVLIGSHNWSTLGVTLNRDASIVFDDEEIAKYYAEAFEIDWSRSSSIVARRFRRESPVLEATTAAAPAGYRRMELSEALLEG
jgi:phosphatidylserine/phosphatidylglycerophosphate/cardiolipin synthase-like enzyme